MRCCTRKRILLCLCMSVSSNGCSRASGNPTIAGLAANPHLRRPHSHRNACCYAQLAASADPSTQHVIWVCIHHRHSHRTTNASAFPRLKAILASEALLQVLAIFTEQRPRPNATCCSGLRALTTHNLFSSNGLCYLLAAAVAIEGTDISIRVHCTGETGVVGLAVSCWDRG